MFYELALCAFEYVLGLTFCAMVFILVVSYGISWIVRKPIPWGKILRLYEEQEFPMGLVETVMGLLIAAEVLYIGWVQRHPPAWSKS